MILRLIIDLFRNLLESIYKWKVIVMVGLCVLFYMFSSNFIYENYKCFIFGIKVIF